MSFSFGVPTTTAAAASSTSGGFMLGGTTAATTTAPTFGATSSAPAFSFGSLAAGNASAAATAGALPSFGSLGAGDASGFRSFAAPAATASATAATPGASLFGGGASLGPAATTASTFSLNPSTSAPSMGLGTTPTSSTLSFGLKPTGTSFGFGTPATAAATALGAAKTVTFGQTTVAPALSQPATVPATTPAPSGFTSTANTGFSLGGTPTASVTPSTGFGVAPQTKTTAPAFSLTTTTAATTSTATLGASLGYKPPTATTSAPPLGLSFGTSLASTGTPLLGASTTTNATSASLTSATTTTSSSAAGDAQPTPKQMTYSQLEEYINKWTLELEEQEKVFLNQATQVNAWDRMLLESGDKIAALNTTIEGLKMEQSKLDLEIDYITSQERELDEALKPLEKAVASMTTTESERQQVYELAANLDLQTKQMAEQLKETIGHLNELNRAQDETNPVIQINRIMNAHMNSLQWIEQTTNSTQAQLEETAKVIEVMKKDAEHPYNVSGYFV